jgi:hypothetical protein
MDITIPKSLEALVRRKVDEGQLQHCDTAPTDASARGLGSKTIVNACESLARIAPGRQSMDAPFGLDARNV